MKELGKKYPRIFSISTVGIRNHNNADYLIHPLRTDFTGESTTGKSLVGADLPQLILTAGNYYKSATPPKGGVQREFNTIPLPGLSFAYAFLNIEWKAKEFIVIGVQIKNSRKVLIPFIIQGEKYLGYEPKETSAFKPLNRVIRFKDFLIDETEMPTIDNLKDYLDKQGIFLKSFYQNENDYHKLLFDNEILHLDLSRDKKLQRQFANTLQSLSRGEDIETSGMKFKKFLFHYDNQVEDKFKKESDEIEQAHRNFQSNSAKHLTFTEKKENLKLLLELKKSKEVAFEMRLKSETTFKFQQVKEQEIKLEEVRKLYFQTELEILALKEKKIQIEIENQESELKVKSTSVEKQQIDYNTAKSFFEDYEKEHSSLSELLPFLDTENNLNKVKYEKFEQVEKWVREYSSISNIKMKYNTQLEIHRSAQKLSELNNFINENDFLTKFEESEYSKSIYSATEFYLQRKKELTDQINGIRRLTSIIEQQAPNSFAGWALSNKKELNELQEAVLFHFASNPVTEFDSSENYIPEPEEFIESLKTAKKTDSGFIINLAGLHYHVAKRPVYIFTNPDDLQKEIEKIGKNYQIEIDILQDELNKIEELQNRLILSFKYSEEHLTAYLNRDKIQSYRFENSFLNFTQTLFDEAIEIYETDLNLNEDQKIKTIYYKSNSEYADKLGKLNSNKEKLKNSLIAKDLADSNIKAFAIEINSLNEKINLLKNTDLVEINTLFVNWKSNIENPFKDNCEGLFQKYKNSFKGNNNLKVIDDTLLNLAGKRGSFQSELSSINILIPHLRESFERQSKEYSNFFKNSFDENALTNKVSEEDLIQLKETESNTKNYYKHRYDSIIQLFPIELLENPVMREHDYNFNQLLFELIPRQLITNKEKPEESLMNDIENILANLNQKIQVLNEEETRKIHSTIHMLKEIVEKHINDLEKIQTHFKEFKLANHHSITLEFSAAEEFDINWIRKFKEDSQNASFMKSFGFNLNESAHSILERIFKEYCPRVIDPKANQILDPFNYYYARTKLIDSTGTEKAATGGTGYGLLALVGIAKLSLVEGKRNIRDVKPGIRILPVDEVAGLGGNFEMLYELAQMLDYQIFTMTISANDLNFQEGKQIYYEFIGSANPEKPYLNEGVHACFSKTNTIFDIEKYFSDKIFHISDSANNVI